MRNLTLVLMLIPLCFSSVALAQDEKPEAGKATPPPFEVKLKLPGAADFPSPLLNWQLPTATWEMPRLKFDPTLPPPPQEAPSKPHQRIGIKMGAVEAPLATHLGVASEDVVLILDVIAGSPASRAGLERYDVITHLDGAAPVTNDTLIEAVQSKKPGDTLDLRILRRARAMEIAVKIQAPPTIVTTDAWGRYRWTGIVSRPTYVTTRSKDTVLYVTPSVSQGYLTLGAVAQPMDHSKVLERLAKMEKRLARMEKLLEEARER